MPATICRRNPRAALRRPVAPMAGLSPATRHPGSCVSGGGCSRGHACLFARRRRGAWPLRHARMQGKSAWSAATSFRPRAEQNARISSTLEGVIPCHALIMPCRVDGVTEDVMEKGAEWEEPDFACVTDLAKDWVRAVACVNPQTVLARGFSTGFSLAEIFREVRLYPLALTISCRRSRICNNRLTK